VMESTNELLYISSNCSVRKPSELDFCSTSLYILQFSLLIFMKTI